MRGYLTYFRLRGKVWIVFVDVPAGGMLTVSLESRRKEVAL